MYIKTRQFSEYIRDAGFHGEWYDGEAWRRIYATDASAYREIPAGVALPKVKNDIRLLILAANELGLSLIPRSAGTSLGGQVVGNGVIVDVSKYLNKIINIDVDKRQVTVEPGINRDELNLHLKPHGLFFAPETSTSNRALIGGMIGNNSCGLHSLRYGSVREHIISAKAYIHSGVEVEFSTLTTHEFYQIANQNDEEGKLYKAILKVLEDKNSRKKIEDAYPHPEIQRRNTGYCLDILAQMQPFNSAGDPFNMAKFLCGSEGTLAFITETTLNLEPLPSPHKAVIPVHVNTIKEALEANLVILDHNPEAIELMDDKVLACTEQNIGQQENRFFFEGKPGAVVIAEVIAATDNELDSKCNAVINSLKEKGYGFHFPIIKGEAINKVWELRKAGLGLLANIPGDKKAVPCIEDTAVLAKDQPQYIADFQKILDKYELDCVYYAHIGHGELHLRPVLDLKQEEDQYLFEQVTDEVANLVKKYRGSLSGEHGDGRVRGPFLRKMVGEEVYAMQEQVKKSFDPKGIFNPGKITSTPSMLEDLRYKPNQEHIEPKTTFRFDDAMGMLRMAEKCNGSGDCRKSHHFKGTMCPSYQATRNEKDTTRARANILREYLTKPKEQNEFAVEEVKEVLDLCLSCKGCTSECPSNVDMTRLKAEFTQKYHDAFGYSLRDWAFAHIDTINKWTAKFNMILHADGISAITKRLIGIHQKRELPFVENESLRSWWEKNKKSVQKPIDTVYFFADEFTNQIDKQEGKDALRLLVGLGYEVMLLPIKSSGRALLSKGFVREAKALANKNINQIENIEKHSIIGLEPSTILSFKDEYPKLVDEHLIAPSKEIAKRSYTLEEFIAKEFEAGNIQASAFEEDSKVIHYHGHCHQKALIGTSAAKTILSIPKNYTVKEIPSGCCGMAGSFGYEKEHYEVSIAIGNLVLLPAVKEAKGDEIISASGTSCRQQIWDGTERKAYHPATILYQALKK